MKNIILFFLFVLFSTNAFSIIYPITPKYVSLKKNKVNLRWNASLDAPIHFIYQNKGLPVLIINEHGNWKKIRDVGGTEGWIHKSMLSNKKTFINKKKQKITNENFEKNLYTSDFPNPDILIRTGGQKRVSNFLLWQIAYTEIFLVDKLRPDFKEKDYNQIIKKFRSTKRNFGSI